MLKCAYLWVHAGSIPAEKYERVHVAMSARRLAASRRVLRAIILLISSLCLLGPRILSQSLRPRLPMGVELPPGFVGGGTCRHCHPRQYASYQAVAMARSLYKPTLKDDPEFSLAPGIFLHAKSGFHYQLTARQGSFYQKRFLLDPLGKPVRVREEKITYVMGSGNHARTYLQHHPDGRITEFPVSWYSQEKAWGMSPGYDSKAQSDFSREVNHECIFCHTSYPKLIRSLAFFEKFFPYELPLGIDCERCHGPGKQHIELAQAGAPLEKILGAVFQPARASKQRQRELCYQCHFDAGSGFARDRVFSPEKDDFSYQPGEPLAQFMINLDYAPNNRPPDEFKIAHQGYRMEQSVCYQKSQGNMTCLTCHDPHQAIRAEDRVRWFRSRCLQCHSLNSCKENMVERRLQGNDCAACHMGKRRPEDAVHTVFTDHKIQRVKPHGDFLAPLAEESPTIQDKDLVFYGAQGLGPVEQKYFLGMAYLQLPPEQLGLSVSQRAKGIRLLQQFLSGVEQSGKQSQYTPYLYRAYLTLAASYHEQGRTESAWEATQRSLELHANFLPAYLYRCGLLSELGKHEDARACFQKSLVLNPWDARVYRNTGSLYAADGFIDEAVRFFKLSLEVSPENSETQHYLADALTEKGDFPAARRSYESAITLEPRDPGIYWDFAVLLENVGEKHLAVQYIRKGLEYAPSDPRGLDLLREASSPMGKHP